MPKINKKTTYTLYVVYPGMDYDEQIRKAAGKRADASGYDFTTGLRDLQFGFKDHERAKVARAKVKALWSGIKVSLRKD